MNTFTIIKEIKAKDLSDALKNESMAKVIQVIDDQDNESGNPIGFRA